MDGLFKAAKVKVKLFGIAEVAVTFNWGKFVSEFVTIEQSGTNCAEEQEIDDDNVTAWDGANWIYMISGPWSIVAVIFKLPWPDKNWFA